MSKLLVSIFTAILFSFNSIALANCEYLPAYFDFEGTWGYQASLENERGLSSIKEFLEEGGNPNEWSYLGTVLMEASRAGNVQIVKLLLDHCADPHPELRDFNDKNYSTFN